MISFVRKAFRICFVVCLWLVLAVCTIGGGVLAEQSRYFGRNGQQYGMHPIVGGFLGLLAGVVINIIVGGFIATFLNIDENLEQLNQKTRSGSSPLNLGNIPPVANKLTKKCGKCKKEVGGDYTSCPHCGNDTFE